MDILIDKLINKITISLYANLLAIGVFSLAVVATILVTTSAHATINCADYSSNGYFERIEKQNKVFAGKLGGQSVTNKTGFRSKVLLASQFYS